MGWDGWGFRDHMFLFKINSKYPPRDYLIFMRIMGYHFSSRLTATLNLCLIYFKITLALAIQ